MQRLVREAMEAGALGLSTGLEFEPGRLATMEEIVDLASVAGEYGGYYTSHIRNRDAALQEAVEECLEVARRAGTPVQVSHLNVRHNTGAADGAWQRAVETVEQARRDGLDVDGGHDAVPRRDRLAGGDPAALVRRRRTGTRRRLLGDPAIAGAPARRVRPLLALHPPRRVAPRARDGQRPAPGGERPAFDEIARLWEQDPWDVPLRPAAGRRAGDGRVTGMALLFTDEHLAEMTSHPLAQPRGRRLDHPRRRAAERAARATR